METKKTLIHSIIALAVSTVILLGSIFMWGYFAAIEDVRGFEETYETNLY